MSSLFVHQAMEKRIPQNPKYKNLQSKIDTGATINKVRLICTFQLMTSL